MSAPPIIGVTACIFHRDPERITFNGRPLLYIEHGMADYVLAHHALPWLIPPTHDSPEFHRDLGPLDVLARCDGLIVPGGVDVAPQSYGEEPLQPQWSGDAVRDAYEIELICAAIEEDIPVLGICRGLQVLNVALGGTLYQDISTQNPGSLIHRRADIYEMNGHRVDLVPGTRLHQIYGERNEGRINSVHHQAIKDLAEGLVVEARCSEDGIIEAVRRPQERASDPYIAAVQWHPEFQHDYQSELLSRSPILEDFLQAVEHRRNQE